MFLSQTNLNTESQWDVKEGKGNIHYHLHKKKMVVSHLHSIFLKFMDLSERAFGEHAVKTLNGLCVTFE